MKLKTLCLSLIVLTPSLSFAAESEYRQELGRRFAESALEGATVPLLEVQPPEGGRERARESLLEFLRGSGLRRIHAERPEFHDEDRHSHIMMAADDSWYAEVMADGSKIRYLGNIDDETEIRAARAYPELHLNQLQELGSKFIEQHLRKLIKVGEKERIVFLGSRTLVRQGEHESGERSEEDPIAYVAQFGREVHGQFVVGSGSSIAVWFSRAGEPVGFEFDWPTYRFTGLEQSTLPIDQTWERTFQYGNHPPEQVLENFRGMECGYLDLGATRRTAHGLLQPGCIISHAGTDPERGVSYASFETIPLGEWVVEDSRLPVTKFIAEGYEWNFCLAHEGDCDPVESPEE